MVTRVTVPKLDQAMEKCVIGSWLKKEGERVRKGEPIVRVEADKASFEIEAERDGYLRKILRQEGEIVNVGETIAYIADSMDEELPEVKPEEESLAAERPEVRVEEEEGGLKVSPLARKIAREKGVDLTKVKGTGPGGRILAKDVLAYIEETAQKGGEQIVRLSQFRRVTAEKMSESKRTIPHFYVQMDVDATELVKLRKSLSPEIEKLVGTKLAYDDLIMKAVAMALREFPALNSSFKDGEVVIFPDINICIAIAVDDELVAPVIRNADRKRISEIARERSELVERARARKLEIKDLHGGTFTISNVGMFNVEWVAAIINPPQAAILSVGSIKDTPVVVDDRVEIRKIMKMVLSADHRVVDGATACRFLGRVKEILENPYLLLRDGL